MANPTTNLTMTKPTVGASADSWGTTLNENVVDVIDALFSISGTDVTMSDIKFNSVGLQETGSGTDTVKIQAPSAVTQYTLTMPGAVGSDGQVLSADGAAGVLEWTTPETGDITAITAGDGLSGTDLSGPVPTLNVDASQTQITSVGALNVGSITSGFTSIDVGAGAISTTGTVAAGVVTLPDDGALTLGTGDDAEVYYDGTNMYIKPSSRVIISTGSGSTLPTLDNTTGLVVRRNAGGADARLCILAHSTGSSYLEFSDDDSEIVGYIQYSHNSNYMRMATGGTERMRIDSSGNVGIGLTSLSYKLDVSGTVRLAGLPTSDPSVANALWNESGTMKISAG